MFDVLYLNKQQDLETYKNIISTSFSDSAYNTVEYFDVFCGGIDGLVCLVFKKDKKTIILPGYIKNINIHDEDTGFKDFSTPYGYTGSYYSTSVNVSDLEEFWNNVKNWLSDNNIVSAFVRFNLFYNYIGFNGQIHNTMLNIKGEIIDKETQWNNFEHKVRKNVKKAIRENLTSKIYYKNIDDDVIESFHEVYIETMKRTNANDSFFYTLDQFKVFCSSNENLCAICNIYDGDVVVSSELLLISDNSVFSFLGGTLEAYFDKRPNDFLKFEVINWARENGFDYYILGGGYGYEDGIFKYKKSFFPDNVVTYKTGRLIINHNVYTSLGQKNNQQRIKKGLSAVDLHDESFFPIYNKQN
ncbi:GNAT family N-acetyltransferase [Chryseobacterium sp. RLHN22]|uniref:GNAT family N-acetyltransferase n=1 Tax=Chryseobacterium sp. RLHN22 TaxID=3437885 RepID=UPI003D9AC46B